MFVYIVLSGYYGKVESVHKTRELADNEIKGKQDYSVEEFYVND